MRNRKGNAATVATSFIALMCCSAMVVDLGYLYSAHTDLQAATDAGVLAGVGYLDGTSEGIAEAKAQAVLWTERNTIMAHEVNLSLSDVTSGYIDADSGDFVASTDPDVVDALSIDHTASGLPTFFAGVAFDRASLEASTSSVARRSTGGPAGRVSCFLPLAIPDCMLTDPSAAEGLELRLNSANNDNAGWADPNANPTPGSINQAMMGQCDHGDAWVDDNVFLNNGVINSSLMTLKSILNGSTSADTVPWNTDAYGPIPSQMSGSTVSSSNYGDHVLEGPIVLFKADSNAACGSDVQFNQTKPITGFVWAAIYDVDSDGNGKNIRAKLDLTNEYDFGTTGGGHPDANVVASGTGSLVR